jgi:predicted regulator of Ras-like GTPase activity (Roadblock/LC7/MglB family)
MRSTPVSEMKFREIKDKLRNTVSGTKAIFLIGPDGGMLDHLVLDPHFDVEAFVSEYAMLLRIARRTSEDTGAGDLTEHVVVSDRSFTVARCFASDFYLILISDVPDQLGRARYELKRAAQFLERNQ